MTVQEAIEILSKFNPQAQIKVFNDTDKLCATPVFTQEYGQVFIDPSYKGQEE